MRICLVGPVPPPYGGMSVQTLQLGDLLRKEGLEVITLPVNFPFPKWLHFVDKLKYIRATVRLFFYFVVLFRMLRRVDLIHILSNSYLNFFLYTTPALIVAKFYGRKVIINYRGGLAREFLAKYKWAACRFFRSADAIIVPSEFLVDVFKEYGYMPYIVPNVIDLGRFFNQEIRDPLNGPIRLLVVRNLEKIYNVGCAIRAFHYIQKAFPQAKLILVGEGTEERALKRIVSNMKLEGVVFGGRVHHQDLPKVYKEATVVLNPSDADNFPISVLEALASGVPLVSTNVGGIPYLIKDGLTGLLVNRNDAKEMADRVLRLLQDKDLYQHLSENGQKEALKYSWDFIRPKLFGVYRITLGKCGAPL